MELEIRHDWHFYGLGFFVDFDDSVIGLVVGPFQVEVAW